MAADTPRIVIIQRAIPHYRRELFEALSRRFNLKVASADNTPGVSNLKQDLNHDWAELYPFIWRDGEDLNGRIKVPTGQILKDLKPDIVITEGSMGSSVLFDLLKRRLLRRGSEKIVVWGHGWNMGRGFGSLSDKASQFGRILPYALVDAHITYTEEGATYLKHFLPKKPVYVAHNTQHFDVDAAALETSIARTVRGDTPFTLVASGRFTPDKNFPALVRMFKSLRAQIGDVRLILIGDGPDRAQVEAEAQGLPDDAITLPGLVYDPEELAGYFLQGEVACYTGAVGLAVNHALAFGLPFVAFERGFVAAPYHHPEITYVKQGLTGHRVPGTCVDVMAACITKLAQNRADLADMRWRCAHYYRMQLSMESYIEAYSSALSTIIAGG